jgi:hypothetical protein
VKVVVSTSIPRPERAGRFASRRAFGVERWPLHREGTSDERGENGNDSSEFHRQITTIGSLTLATKNRVPGEWELRLISRLRKLLQKKVLSASLLTSVHWPVHYDAGTAPF